MSTVQLIRGNNGAKSRPRARRVVRKQHVRSANKVLAAASAGFLPVASYLLAHYEADARPLLWVLVAAALLYSLPTLAEWAARWCRSWWKACAFAVLLDGVMVASDIQPLALCGLAILVLINSAYAWERAK